MARIIKVFLIFVFSIILFSGTAFAEGEQTSLSTLITAQNVPFERCYAIYNTDNVSLFFLTLAGINANRFQVNEIQSKSGYILFTAVNKQFLASISNVNKNQGLLRITPVDGVYYFQPGIVLNIFKFVELNVDKKPQVIF
ncbi:hypothetical protein IKR55_03050 [bacterium]|nr:hypothetical protein [bacterium]